VALDAQKFGVGTTVIVMLRAPEKADEWFESFDWNEMLQDLAGAIRAESER